jgi:ketosteroid isomerase-like protein
MKKILFVLLVVAFTFGIVSCAGVPEESKAAPTVSPVASTPANTEDTPKVIMQLEREWIAAILAKDTAAIDRLLAADFIGTTNDQKYFKEDAIEDVQTGMHESLELENLEVRVFGNTAIATMSQNEKSRHVKEDFSGRYLFTNVWVKTDGQWRAVASHGSRIR